MNHHSKKEKNTGRAGDTVYRLIIVGGGAAGLYAGAVSSYVSDSFPSKPGSCLILEKKEQPGKKLLITGAGQCNLTHDGSIKDFLPHYHDSGKKIRTALYSHSNQQVCDFLAEEGISTFSREDGKIFPESLSAKKVRDSLARLCERNGFIILRDTPCTGLKPLFTKQESGAENGCGALAVSSSARWEVRSGKQKFLAENVLIATGGASVPQTGSDGSFLNILEELDIPIEPLTAALAPVYVQQYPFSELSGISFPDAKVVVQSRDGAKKEERQGAILLTHDSFSGPCIIDGSRWTETGDTLKISWLSDLRTEELVNILVKSGSSSKAAAGTIIAKTLKDEGYSVPQRFLELQLERCGFDASQKAAQTGKKAWQSAARVLTEDVYSVSGKGSLNAAMATRGGVSLESLNLKTMESKQYPGLWFAGEVVDIDGDTGGYNLQFAFSSAACAIKNMFSSKKEKKNKQ